MYYEESRSRHFFGTIWRSMVVAITYFAATMGASWVISNWGGKFPETSQDTDFFFLIFLMTGFLIAITIGPIISKLDFDKSKVIWIVAFAIFFNIVSVTIEGHFFAPELMPKEAISPIMGQQLIAALITAIVIAMLFTNRNKMIFNLSYYSRPESRRWYSWVWRYLTATLSYVVFYFIFGAINYFYVTKSYYESNVSGLVVPEPSVILIAEIIRAQLIVISILPLILSAKISKNKLAIYCGLILFVIGGIVPLLLQIGNLPPVLLVASGVEIFFQNFLTGVVVVLLLGRKM